jgi:hypothetical protein
LWPQIMHWNPNLWTSSLCLYYPICFNYCFYTNHSCNATLYKHCEAGISIQIRQFYAFLLPSSNLCTAQYNHTCYSCYHSSCDHTAVCTVVTATDALTLLNCTYMSQPWATCIQHTRGLEFKACQFILSYFRYRTWPGPVLLGMFNLNGNT